MCSLEVPLILNLFFFCCFRKKSKYRRCQKYVAVNKLQPLAKQLIIYSTSIYSALALSTEDAKINEQKFLPSNSTRPRAEDNNCKMVL